MKNSRTHTKLVETFYSSDRFPPVVRLRKPGKGAKAGKRQKNSPNKKFILGSH